MSIVFVLNPAAGKTDSTARLRGIIERHMAGDGREYEIYATSAPGDATRFVRARAQTGRDLLFVACGGDGTLKEVAAGVYGQANASVAHYPCGTGNDFIKHFGMPADTYRDLSLLLNGEPREIDVVDAGGDISVNICSVGFDAKICDAAQRMKRLPFLKGPASYNFAVLTSLLGRIWGSFRVKVDGKKADGEYTILVAANGSHYGGDFLPVPEADVSDGVLDFLLVKKVSKAIVAKVVGKYKQGKYREKMEYFTKLTGKTMEISADRPFYVNCDGEVLKTSSITFALAKKRLRFVLPRRKSFA